MGSTNGNGNGVSIADAIAVLKQSMNDDLKSSQIAAEGILIPGIFEYAKSHSSGFCKKHERQASAKVAKLLGISRWQVQSALCVQRFPDLFEKLRKGILTADQAVAESKKIRNPETEYARIRRVISEMERKCKELQSLCVEGFADVAQTRGYCTGGGRSDLSTKIGQACIGILKIGDFLRSSVSGTKRMRW